MAPAEHLSGVALVIGSASGIGRATALSYARYGVRGLVVADINEPGVRRTAEEAERDATNPDFEVLALFTDVRKYESVENVFDKAVEKFGRIDYSVTTAGVSSTLTLPLARLNTKGDADEVTHSQIWRGQGPLADNPLEQYENIMATNATGVLHHTKAAVRVMRGQEPLVVQGEDRARVIGRGSIVNTASVLGIAAMPGSVEYNSSKFAAIGITKTAGLYSPGLPLNQPASSPQPNHSNEP